MPVAEEETVVRPSPALWRPDRRKRTARRGLQHQRHPCSVDRRRCAIGSGRRLRQRQHHRRRLDGAPAARRQGRQGLRRGLQRRPDSGPGRRLRHRSHPGQPGRGADRQLGRCCRLEARLAGCRGPRRPCRRQAGLGHGREPRRDRRHEPDQCPGDGHLDRQDHQLEGRRRSGREDPARPAPRVVGHALDLQEAGPEWRHRIERRFVDGGFERRRRDRGQGRTRLDERDRLRLLSAEQGPGQRPPARRRRGDRRQHEGRDLQARGRGPHVHQG